MFTFTHFHLWVGLRKIYLEKNRQQSSPNELFHRKGNIFFSQLTKTSVTQSEAVIKNKTFKSNFPTKNKEFRHFPLRKTHITPLIISRS